jgi:hypothetical protein
VAKAASPMETAAKVLEGYASRGVFRGFSRGPTKAGKTTFKLLWHRDQAFELILNDREKKLRFPMVLPQVPAGSPMNREFKHFVESAFSKGLPEHRRIDRRKMKIACANRGGNVSLTVTVAGRNFDYAVRKLIHLVHDVYLTFLNDGRYYEYMIEVFNLDPDTF